MFIRARCLCAGLVLFLISGCGESVELPTTVPVTGTVLYKDAPVEGAEVTFQPKSKEGKVYPARGTTNASGEFTLKTYVGPGNDLDGAVPGDYVVSVTKVDTKQMTPEEMMKQASKVEASKSSLPAIYTDAQKSGLTATVPAGGLNDVKFELKGE